MMTTNNHQKKYNKLLKLIWEVTLLLLKILLDFGIVLYRIIVPLTKKSVKGEIVLITGAGHGIGRELSLLYAAEEAIVVCCDINEEGNKETVEAIAKLGYNKAFSYKCDVSNRKQVMEMVEKIHKDVGEVTILINNAGIMPAHSLLEHTQDEIERIMNVNVMGNFWTIQAILPTMLKNNYGHIVAISSCCGVLGMLNLIPYCASKFAIRGLMDALDKELRQNPKCNIKTTCVYPYIIDTGLCKRANIRFPNLTPILKQREVAEFVMSAQRRDIVEISMPKHLLPMHYWLKIFPENVHDLVINFMNITVESDL